MVAFNFKAEFADDVESGAKRQTIRAGEARCKAGDALQLYTGMRVKGGCRKLRDGVCAEVRSISIVHDDHMYGGYQIVLNRQRLDDGADRRILARADGFENACALCRWFEAEHGLPFNGHVVNW